ncbi:PP2C family serine/threonine-protein phosphatase [Proteus hauseri]|uniref:PP2C family serine/threonine-protein phosphatase n=1 Tax=Proteus hauseri TaxID=183417 RepID=UPI0010094CE4|nr:PP2C family serine/threonine-protein phosphatase [Proteus hauseri]QAV23781.1 hypothetical protein PH4a_10710 [Proteus hauseri]
MNDWLIYGASVIGAAHQEHQIPCQDAYFVRRKGEYLIAAVCDGAGSSRYSEQGAKLAARLFTLRITEWPDIYLLTEKQVKQGVYQLIEDIRLQLAEYAEINQCELNEYASTLVACWIGDDGGYLFHLGDGIAVVEFSDGTSYVSQPENGEYANQTWFVTSESWQEHLRVTPLTKPVTQVVLMSDGVQPFAMNKNADALYEPFIQPVIRYLKTVSEDAGSEALAGTLADSRTHSITGDDKTLVICFRNEE